MKNIILALIVTIPCLVHAQGETAGVNPPNLNKLSYQEANDAIGAEIQAIRMGKRTINQEYIASTLFELKETELSNENRVLIIYFFGELRLNQKNVIEALIADIDLKAEKLDLKMNIRRWGQYPAEEALIRIGGPAVDPILDSLPNENSELRKRLMCNVVRQVLRRDFMPVAHPEH